MRTILLFTNTNISESNMKPSVTSAKAQTRLMSSVGIFVSHQTLQENKRNHTSQKCVLMFPPTKISPDKFHAELKSETDITGILMFSYGQYFSLSGGLNPIMCHNVSEVAGFGRSSTLASQDPQELPALANQVSLILDQNAEKISG